MITSLDQIVQQVKSNRRITIAVAQAVDEYTMQSVAMAHKQGLADFLLVGKPDDLKAIVSKMNLPWVKDEYIIPAANDSDAAQKAVRCVLEKRAATLLKGHLHTGSFLKAVLNKEEGLRGDGLLSQCGVFENPFNGRLLFITDCAMNNIPDLLQKKAILENAVKLATSLGIIRPKVAVLTALETVNPDMPETLDAAVLSQMCARGQIQGCIVDGPLAMDNAVSVEAARNKNLHGEVAGNADIILVPDLKTGNAIHKTLTYFTSIKNAAACLGATCPIIMTSRTDPIETKVFSIALGCKSLSI